MFSRPSRRNSGAWRSAAAAAAVLALFSAPVGAEDFSRVFGPRYQAAARFVLGSAASWGRVLARAGADPRVLLPVVFPEVLRYSPARDDVEALGLETLYVSGAARADFSIGRFQMKPSFAEAVERGLASLSDLPRALAAVAAAADGRADARARAARVARLRDGPWQLLYLAGFARVVDERFGPPTGSLEDRIAFTAAAYNHGFWHTAAEISAAEDWKLFPAGSAGTPGPFRYVDVALDFNARFGSELQRELDADGP